MSTTPGKATGLSKAHVGPAASCIAVAWESARESKIQSPSKLQLLEMKLSSYAGVIFGGPASVGLKLQERLPLTSDNPMGVPSGLVTALSISPWLVTWTSTNKVTIMYTRYRQSGPLTI